MPLSTTPSEEIEKQTQAEKATFDLRERFDHEFNLYRGNEELYAIPASEGEWDKIVTNRAFVETNRVIDDIAVAFRKLWIPISDEDHRDRKALSDTEKAALGILHLADLMNEDLPFNGSAQSELATWRVLRGMSAKRLLLREEEGKLIPDLAIWDPRNTYWQEGRKRLLWVCYVRWSTMWQVKNEYPGWNGKAEEGTENLVKIYDVYECSDPAKPAEAGVIIGSEYVKKPEKITVGDEELNYLPINISTGRSLPIIYDGKNTDNVKFASQGFITNNAKLYPLESRILSYQLTRAGQLAKAPIIVQYDSQNGGLPPGMEKDPYVKGRVIFLDKAKGQEMAQSLIPPSSTDIMQIYADILALEGLGGLNPVAFGRINTALPAQGIDILEKASLAVERPFIKGVEKDWVWLAGEAIRQYKMGKFETKEFEGFDKSNNSFVVTVNPKDINENWRFTCKLVLESLRDKAASINVASQAVKDGLLSRQTARDQFQLVLDTDEEEAKVAKETARGVLGTGEMEALLALIEDYSDSPDENKLFIINFAAQRLMAAMQEMAGETKGGGSEPAQQENNTRVVTSNTPTGAQIAEG